jgi:hypothetical protein
MFEWYPSARNPFVPNMGYDWEKLAHIYEQAIKAQDDLHSTEREQELATAVIALINDLYHKEHLIDSWLARGEGRGCRGSV